MRSEEKKDSNKQEFPNRKKDEQKEALTTQELGRRFFERLKKQGPTLDRVGQSFVLPTKRKPG